MRVPNFLALAILALAAFAAPQTAYAQTSVSVNFDFDSVPPVATAPPQLPVYVVPPPPDDGLVWLPGYWSWDGYDFFWIPGTWVQPPVVGYLWTPGYWAWEENAYYWHEGYWSRHVGYYGGIEYGGGYDGVGFNGGAWNGNRYIVNLIVVNVPNIRATRSPHPSFHGGQGGATADPTAEQARYMNEHHIHPARAQIDHAQLARRNAALRVSSNHGTPPVAATASPGEFTRNIVPAQSETPRGNERNEIQTPQPAASAKPVAAPRQQRSVVRSKPARQPAAPAQQAPQPAPQQPAEPETHSQHQEQAPAASQSNLHLAPVTYPGQHENVEHEQPHEPQAEHRDEER